jgi:two-component system phosphate regulon sensor histidine kinase PhoR
MTGEGTDHAQFQAVLDGLDEGVLALNADERVTHVNTVSLSLLDLKYPPLGRTLHEAIRVPALHDVVHAAHPGKPATVEFDMPVVPPRRLLARVTKHVENGGITVVFHDLTELRQLESVRKDFVANVSHELRTPVSIILANTETLLDGALEDKEHAEGFLGALRRNAERLSSLISDLLVISRLDAGQYALELDAVNVATIIRRAVNSMKAAADKRDLSLSSQLSDSELQVVADEEALQKVIFNLLDNAVKYADRGGEIVVSAKLIGSRVHLEVRDTGPGIEPGLRRRIFERFYRIDPGRSREMGGTGLGLSIVKNLTESMGGAVGVEGATPRGTVFWVSLDAANVTQRAPVLQKAPDQFGAALDFPAAQQIRSETRPVDAAKPKNPNARDAHEKGLVEIRKRLLLMVGSVEEMISLALQSLIDHDAALAGRTIRSDRRVNRAEIEIDELCLVMLENHRPADADLRFITLALKMVVDLERIGDLAVNICERAIDLANEPMLHPYSELGQMAGIVREMLRDVVDAFVDNDADKAQQVIERDDLVDHFYTDIFRTTLDLMLGHVERVERGVHIQSIAKWLERMADHITNMAEQIIFAVKGKDIRHMGKLDVR